MKVRSQVNANELYERGMRIWREAIASKNMDRKKLLEAFRNLEKASEELQDNDFLLAQLARISLFLNDNERAENFANRALEINPSQFDARYALYLVAYDRFLERRRHVVINGGLLGILQNTKKYVDVKAAKEDLIEAKESLVLVAHETLTDEVQTIENILYVSDVLIDSAQSLSEVDVPFKDMALAVVDDLDGLLEVVNEELHDKISDRIASADDLARFK